MARLGNRTSDKKTESGKKYFGDKDVQYLKEKSREAIEEDQDFTILYFKLDWHLSRKNFYGELLTKKFVETKGVPVKGAIKIQEGDETIQNGINSKRMSLTLVAFTEHLKELNIEPTYDDYFAIGKRFYRIETKTVKDVGPGNILLNRERLQVSYKCYQDDDEVLQKDVWGDNLGTEEELNPQNGIID